jgi:hypothetical protein
MALRKRKVRRSSVELLNWLRPRFEEFNRQFFGAKLPEYEILIENLIGGLTIIQRRNGKYQRLPDDLKNELYGLCLAEDHRIYIDSICSNLEDEGLREVLLHEMCHAEVYRNAPVPPTGDPHGQEFVAELHRLASLGETWAGEQAQYYRTVPQDQQAKFPLDAWRATLRK